MEKKPDFEKLSLKLVSQTECRDCEKSIYQDGVVAGCEKIWTDYVTPLQSQLSEAEKRIKELEEISADDDHAILILEDQLKKSESQNERLLSALKDEMSPRVAKLLLKIRDEITKWDASEAYHALYEIASPDFDKTEPWGNIERIAKTKNNEETKLHQPESETSFKGTSDEGAEGIA